MVGRGMTRVLFGMAVSVALLGDPSAGEASAGAYRVIVNPANPVQHVERRFLAQVFLKKVTLWPDGESIHPVDLPPDSPVRHTFVEDVLGRSISAVKSYWQALIFSGRTLPPPELDSEKEIVSYVLGHRGAIGYVSDHADIGSAKVLSVN